jgi:hypothetical protein
MIKRDVVLGLEHEVNYCGSLSFSLRQSKKGGMGNVWEEYGVFVSVIDLFLLFCESFY